MFPKSSSPPGVSAFADAVNLDAYKFLEISKPDYLEAVEAMIREGSLPGEVEVVALRELGPDRTALARRCAQAAEHIYSKLRGEFETDDAGRLQTISVVKRQGR